MDPSQPIPVFAQLKAHLIKSIIRGQFGTDGQLPTEVELCSTYSISRTPVHRALTELADEGAVIRHRRRGTFVNPHWVVRHASSRAVRVVVPEGPWIDIVKHDAPEDLSPSLAVVDLASLHEHLTRGVASGLAPDLALVDSVWVSEFASAGFLRPLDDLDPAWTENEYKKEFAPAFVESHLMDGHTMAAQAEADVAGLWFDRAVLERCGIAPPRTWQELTDAFSVLAAAGKLAPLGMPAGPAAGEAASFTLLGLLASNGAAVLDDRGITLHLDEAVKALEFVRSLVDSGALSVEAVTAERERPMKLLASGDVVFALGGSYELPALAGAREISQEAAWEHFGFVRTPVGPGPRNAVLAGGMAFAIFRQSDRPELAMHLLRSLVSPSSQLRMARSTGQMPSRTSVMHGLTGNESLPAQSARMLQGAVVRPRVPSYDRVSQQLQGMLADVILGRQAPALAAAHTSELIAAITGLRLAD
ncbi:MAG: extracellular solute-binding protein [Micrococcales bacterium]|nr:extracellular solute-binding protein [Micrococcales bacterium]